MQIHTHTHTHYFYQKVTIPPSSINLLLKQGFRELEGSRQKDISATQTIIVSPILFYYVLFYTISDRNL